MDIPMTGPGSEQSRGEAAEPGGDDHGGGEQEERRHVPDEPGQQQPEPQSQQDDRHRVDGKEPVRDRFVPVVEPGLV